MSIGMRALRIPIFYADELDINAKISQTFKRDHSLKFLLIDCQKEGVPMRFLTSSLCFLLFFYFPSLAGKSFSAEAEESGTSMMLQSTYAEMITTYKEVERDIVDIMDMAKIINYSDELLSEVKNDHKEFVRRRKEVEKLKEECGNAEECHVSDDKRNSLGVSHLYALDMQGLYRDKKNKFREKVDGRSRL